MSRIEYQPAIDGLRAIAVAAVLLFHLDERWLPGGFTGVDIFFSVSGYLITSILLADASANGISLKRFYQRRISRIFPASALVCVVVLLAAMEFYLPEDCASVGATVSAAAVSAVNIKLLGLGDYFEISTDAQPLLHYWTLAVEEQFYLLLPFAMSLVYAKTVNPSRTAFRLFAIVGVLSFVGAICLSSVRPTWSFFLLPTRAWELLVGCLLAIRLPELLPRIRARSANVAAVSGILLIGSTFFGLQADSGTPGLIAVIPVLGTLLIIAGTQQQNIVTTCLSLPVMTAVGRASYSLYLWHWPVYCFVDYEMYTATPGLRLALKLLLTAVLAWTAYFAFETPSRRFLNLPERAGRTFAGFAASVALLFALGVWTRIEYDVTANARLADVQNGGVVLNVEDSRPCIVLVGDSNASMYGSAVQDIAESLEISAYSLGVPRNDPFPGNPLFDKTLVFLKKQRPEIVIFVARWSTKLDPKGAILQASLRELELHADHVILLTEPPELPPDASRAAIRKMGPHAVFEDDATKSMRLQANALLSAAANDRVHLLDISEYFQLPSGEIRLTTTDGRQLFRDKSHLSGCGTELIRPLLELTVSRYLDRTITERSGGVDGRFPQRDDLYPRQDGASQARIAGEGSPGGNRRVFSMRR